MGERALIPHHVIEKARRVRIEDEIERRGIKLAGKIDRCGSCPLCGSYAGKSVTA